MHHHRWEQNDQQHHDDLDDDERHRTPIDLAGRNRVHPLAGDAVDVGFLRRYRAQIEQCKPEWRMHERGLHVNAENYSEPDQVDAEVLRGRPKQRNDDEGKFEEIEEEGEHEDEGVDENEEPDLAAGQGGQEMFDPDVTVDTVEGQRENARSDQDENHE